MLAAWQLQPSTRGAMTPDWVYAGETETQRGGTTCLGTTAELEGRVTAPD